MSYLYNSLTSAIDDKRSPLRQFLESRLPNKKALQADYRAHCGRLLVEGGDANAGTLGAAFDYLVRYLLDGSTKPAFALQAFKRHPHYLQQVAGLALAAERAASLPESNREELDRACWALALSTEVYRARTILPGSPLRALALQEQFTTQALLDLAPDDALRQLRALESVAATSLLPHLVAPFHIGPTFDASRFCAADADLIADGLLLDIKTHLGVPGQDVGSGEPG